MRFVRDLWRDEQGAVLTAEAVMVGTVAVLGSVVGLNTAATAIDDELKEFGSAIRSLDQSYAYAGHRSCRAWSAGSYYRQPDVKVALAELCGEGSPDVKAIQRDIDSQRAESSVVVDPKAPANELPKKKPAKPKD